MAVNLTEQDIYWVLLRDIFYTVQNFEWGDLIPPLKNRLIIRQSAGDLFNINLIVDVDSRLEPNASASLPPLSSIGSQENTSFLTTHACNNFVTTYINNKIGHVATSAAEEKKLTADLILETTKLLQHQKFAPRQFRLNTLCARPLLAETANAIRM